MGTLVHDAVMNYFMFTQHMFGYSPYQFGVDSNTLPVVQNLVAWLDAAACLTITQSGGTVSQWDDKSGNGHNAVQGDTGLQPAYIEDAVNGLPILRFDGSADVMSLQSVIISGTVGRTIFVVGQADVAADDGLISLTTTNTSGARYDLTSEFGIRVNGGNRFWTVDMTGAYYVITFQNAASSNANVTLGRRDGTVMTESGAASRAIDTGTGGTTRICQVATLNRYFDGDIGEVIFYDRALSGSEIDSVESYLGVKWGISV